MEILLRRFLLRLMFLHGSFLRVGLPAQKFLPANREDSFGRGVRELEFASDEIVRSGNFQTTEPGSPRVISPAFVEVVVDVARRILVQFFQGCNLHRRKYSTTSLRRDGRR